MAPNAATFYVQLTPGVNYVRAELPARYYPGRVVHQPAVTLTKDPPEIEVDNHEGSAAFWMFPGNAVRGVVMANQIRQGVRVLAEVDDNYLLAPPLDFGAWRKDAVNYHDHSYETHEQIVRETAQGLVVSTRRLAEVYADVNDNIFVCENCVDPADWPAAPDHQRDGILRVGWAASDSHAHDGPLIADALRWAAAQKDVQVVIVGIETWAPPCKHLYVPFQDLPVYRETLHRHIDVMLCPLKFDPWTECKSDLKALEGAMSGAVPVMSNQPPYADWKDRPGILCNDAYDFKRGVKRLVNDREATRVLAEEARQWVLDNRDIRKNVWRWQEAAA